MNITTTFGSNASGATTVTAKGAGKQRTIKSDGTMSPDALHGAAAGALLNVLCDDRQRAMLRHPSGGQRVRILSESDAGGKRKWSVNV